MKLFIKIAGWVAVGFVVLIAACVITLKSISNEQYKEWISEAVNHLTGRQLTFDGEVNVYFAKR